MKKMLLAVSALAVLSLSAAEFELKFTGNKANWGEINFWQAKLENKPFGGAAMASTAVTTKPGVAKGVDTGFVFITPVFAVKGKKQLKIEAEIYTTQDLSATGGNSYRSAVIWLKDRASAPKGLTYSPKSKGKLTDFSLKVTKGSFQKIVRTIPVPAGMGAAYVQIGYDYPNLIGKDVFAVKSMKVTAE